MPRYHRVEDIIQLALALQGPGPGLCLEDIQQRFDVGRRTAERMREAVDRLYPGMTSTKGADGRKYWRLPDNQASRLVAWQPDELRALAEAIVEAQRGGHEERARTLEALLAKVETLAPRPSVPVSPEPGPAWLPGLRRSIVEDQQVMLAWRRPDGEGVRARVEPYGLLGGPRTLLVAVHPERKATRLHAFDEILEATPVDSGFERDPHVDLRRYAANAFVPFEEGPIHLLWRFRGPAAGDALEYEFHPEQTLEHCEDGSVEVHFRVASLVEMAWHLFAWGDLVEAVEPPILKHRFDAMMRRALDARPATRAARATPAKLDG